MARPRLEEKLSFVPAKVPPSTQRRLTRRQQRAGGKLTARRYGGSYMVKIGRNGGLQTSLFYDHEHYQEIGRRGGRTLVETYGREVLRAMAQAGGRAQAAVQKAYWAQVTTRFKRLEIDPIECPSDRGDITEQGDDDGQKRSDSKGEETDG